MSFFKDMVAHDIDMVLFNTDELAETHTIDGVDTPIVLNNDVLTERSTTIELNDLYRSGIMYFVKKKDLKNIPIPGQSQFFDGRKMWIETATEIAGVYAITLTQTGSEYIGRSDIE